MATECLPGRGGAVEEAVERAVRLLRDGQTVALPTETVYGLAADALRPEAVVKIFEAKERPFFDPLIVHVPGVEWIPRLTAASAPVNARVRALVERFWPGPLTLVLPRTEEVPDLVTSGMETVAVRMSAHPVFAAVVRAFGKPLAAPSANRFGRISPTCAEHVCSELSGRIPLVVDGGACLHGVESTIVAVRPGGMEILRAGPVTAAELGEFGEVELRSPAAHAGRSLVEAPGQLASHYAPRTLMLLASDLGAARGASERAGLLAWRSVPAGHAFAAVEVLSASGDLREAASSLFAKMRRLDAAGLDLIVAEPVPEDGVGVAIMDRLRRASHRAVEKGSDVY